MSLSTQSPLGGNASQASDAPIHLDDMRPSAPSTRSERQIPTPISKWKGPIIVLASFAVVFTCCGLNFAFGVYQALYESLAAEPNTPFSGATPAVIDLIGTISISLMTMGAPIVVAWAKRFSPRLVSLVGGAIFGLSLILASFGTALWHFHLTQGLLLGIGTCMSYMTAVTIAPTWFTERRGLAMGIILSGTGVGGLVWAPALKASIDTMGFRNTLRMSGAISFVAVALASSAMDWEPVSKARIDTENSARTSRMNGIFNIPLVDMRLARSRKFNAQVMGAVFQAAAYYTPVFFFASYARTLGYSDTAGANFIAISNACNAIGKIGIGYLADYFGRLNTLFVTTFISAIITLGLWFPSTIHDQIASSKNLFIAFSVLYGTFASAYVSLFPASLVDVFGPQHFASVNGVLYMVRGMATLVGTPTGGLLIRKWSGVGGPRSYEAMSLYVSSLLMVAAIGVFWVRLEAMMGPTGVRSWHWKQ